MAEKDEDIVPGDALAQQQDESPRRFFGRGRNPFEFLTNAAKHAGHVVSDARREVYGPEWERNNAEIASMLESQQNRRRSVSEKSLLALGFTGMFGGVPFGILAGIFSHSILIGDYTFLGSVPLGVGALFVEDHIEKRRAEALQRAKQKDSSHEEKK